MVGRCQVARVLPGCPHGCGVRSRVVDVANIFNRTNLRNTPYGVDRVGRVLGATESLMPIVPSGGFVIEF